jgi:hypothetical protein
VPALVLTAIVAAALAGGPDSPDPRPGPPSPGSAPDPEEPPDGSPAEQALWRRAGTTNDRVTTDRSAATRLQLRAKVAVGRLEELAVAGTLPAPRAAELEKDVLAAWTENVSILQRQWPVDPTRACRYDQLYLESAMRLPGSKARDHEIGEATRSLEDCLRRADAALAKLGASSRRLEHEVVEAEKAAGLGAATPAPAPARPGQ